jgi:hypothetical protein
MRRSVLALACALVCAAAIANAAPVQWSTGAGGNGHWYEPVLVGSGITWSDAQAAAVTAGGYLATCTSDGEDQFVYSLIQDHDYWNFFDFYEIAAGPWIGGYQDTSDPSYSEPAGGWKWVTGETWSYTNWGADQPDDTWPGQCRLHYFYRYEWGAIRAWDDAFLDDSTYVSYVVEWDQNPVPEPASILAVLCGLGALARRRR